MLVFGATDFAAAVAPIAKEFGYAVTIADARERFTRAADIVVGWPQDVLADRELDPRDVVLVFTHDPKFRRAGAARGPSYARWLHRRAR